MKLTAGLRVQFSGMVGPTWLLRQASTSPSEGASTLTTSKPEAPAGASVRALRDALRQELRQQGDRVRGTSVAFSTFLPPEGVPMARLERKAALPSAESTKALWDAASAWYYRLPTAATATSKTASPSSGVALMPFDWQAAMQAVAVRLPYEGVTEDVFVARLTDTCPGLSALSAAQLAALLGHSGVPSLAGWVHRHFSEALLLTRSAVTGGVLYYNRGNNNVLPRTAASTVAPGQRRHGLESEARERDVAALQHALHLLGRDKQLPVWTDFATLAPLLPADVCPVPGEWEAFLTRPHLRALFEVEGNVLVRYVGKPMSQYAFIDRTSVSQAEAEAWLARLSGASAGTSDDAEVGGSCPEVKMFVRAKEDAVAGHTGPLRGAEVVVVEKLLDPEHVMGALVSTIGMGAEAPRTTKSSHTTESGDDMGEEAEEGMEDALFSADRSEVVSAQPHTTVHVLCGTRAVDAVTQVLREAQKERQHAPQICIHTPSSQEGVFITRN